MKRYKTVRVTTTLFLLWAMVAPAQPAAATTAGQGEAVLADKAERVQARRAARITQEEREAAAARKKLQMRAAAAATGRSVDANMMDMPMPDPGMVPDYFGMTPNWAYTPKIRKFVDGLPGVGPENSNNLGQYLSVAHPDTITYPGCDYYEIELREYTEQLHSDLPPTTLRGYVQVNYGTDEFGNNTIEPDPIHYLGPTIFATKDRPVRVKFTNALPTGEGGDLFLPVDTTYMGAGMGPEGGMFTQNRAAVHLHGGKTVWISDGTPHQWITPAGEDTTYPAGVSVQNVPDMPDPGDGSTTFFYSNQQSARMLWYHDHSYGITRLTVYSGQAAGYFLTDDTEKELVADGLLPEEQIPLIIQDKTFTDAETIMTTDPTWRWGSMPGMPMTGDLWFPHVYMPAQNPADVSGVNAMGRWHYGPWFWPPTVNIPHPPVPNPYYDPINAPWENELMPGTPYDSSGMEAFQDTPMVNGTPYPVLEVDPKSYRFRILNASSDRFWNLQLYEADPTVVTSDGRRNTEVKMVPAAENPAFPPDWPTDGRAGGVPDPATAGPDWIQVGTEGGFLPQPAVFPNQPITWVTDVTLFNAGNVDKHAMLLAPAERADVVLDFSKYAGKTLILYNDAPAAFPAGDPRYDYYTGAPDMTDTGGHTTPEAGFGPNVRTIMQIKVADLPPAPEFDLAALQAEFVSAGADEGVFERSQNPILVPNDRYDTTYGESFPKDAYVRIADTEFTFKTLDGTEVTFPLEPKAIQDEQGETFDEYGRMSGKLGLERPTGVPGAPNFILYGYIDPATEVLDGVEYGMEALTPVLGDGTQIWKITHNGVDTHPMHFHLYDVQLINRVGWDGFLRYPDDNELGWKDTVRVSPLEDTIVALRPVVPKAPFNVPDSRRPLDPTMPLGSTMGFSTVDPTTGQPYITPIVNEVRDFNWEYVWHCHILSHEEMDMMRPVTVDVSSSVPPAPVLTGSSVVAPGSAQIEWTDGTPGDLESTWGNIASEIGFRIERASISATGLVGPFEPVSSALANQVTGWDPTAQLNARYRYRVVAYNEAGESVSDETTVGPISDTTHPVTTSSVDQRWHRSGYQVSLTATDTLSGVVATYYTLDGGAQQSYAAPIPINDEIYHDLRFWSEDASGNVEPVNFATVRIDDTAPVTESNIDSLWHRSPFAVSLQAQDTLSGVSRSYYRVDGGPVRTYTRAFDVSGEGEHAVEFWTVDRAGNIETAHSATVRIDDTAPVTTSDIDSVWHKNNVTVVLGASDALSGVASTWYSIDGGAQKEYAGPFVVSGDGEHTVDFWSFDAAGNREDTKRGTIRIDATAPVTTSNIDGAWHGAPVTVDLSAIDNLSGVASTRFSVDGAAPRVYTAPFVVVGEGIHEVSYWSVDVAGNAENPVSERVRIDLTAPVTSSDIDGAWHNLPVSVTLMVDDPLSGAASTSYTIDGGAESTYGEPFVVSADGEHEVAFWSTDVVGNVEVARTGTVRIDSVAPVTSDNHTALYVEDAIFELSPSDERSGVAATYFVLDGGAVQEGTSVSTFGIGNHTVSYWSADAAGNVEDAHFVQFSVVAPATTFINLSGPDRISTALAVSRATFPDGSVGTVVVASAAGWPDALVGSSLAGAYGSPILLTFPDQLPASVLAEFARLGVRDVVILGGTGAVSPAVESSIADVLGTEHVTRIGGVDRYATAILVARQTASLLGDAYDGTAFVATGGNFPDALGAGPLAAAKGWPIFLVGPSALGDGNTSAMEQLGVNGTLVLGGTGAVSETVAGELASVVGAEPVRLGGATRYETAIAVAEHGVAEAGLTWDGVALAQGLDFPDALSAGAAQGANRSVLLLTPSSTLDPSVASTLASRKNDIHALRFIGGEAAITPTVRLEVMSLLN